MRQEIKTIVSEKICEAVDYLFHHGATGNPNDYIEEIFKLTLYYLANHFIDAGNLRECESSTLQQLKTSCDAQQDVLIIEKQLYCKLNKITPTLGELFGKDRGEVYNAFLYLKQWPCFSTINRRQLAAEKLRKLETLTGEQHLALRERSEQVQAASQSLKHSQQTTEKAARRSASQFLKIQTLEMENKHLRKQLEAAELRILELSETHTPVDSCHAR